MKRVAFGPPLWLRLLAGLCVAVLAGLAATSRDSSWIFPGCLTLWIVVDFPRSTFVDSTGVWKRSRFGLGVHRVAWNGGWVEHERPAFGNTPGDVLVFGADGTRIVFSGDWKENSRFIAELTNRGMSRSIR